MAEGGTEATGVGKERVPEVVEVSGGPSLDACHPVGVRRSSKSNAQEGDHREEEEGTCRDSR